MIEWTAGTTFGSMRGLSGVVDLELGVLALCGAVGLAFGMGGGDLRVFTDDAGAEVTLALVDVDAAGCFDVDGNVEEGALPVCDIFGFNETLCAESGVLAAGGGGFAASEAAA